MITSEDVPIHDRPYTATCVASFVAAVPLDMVTIEWMTVDGAVLTDVNDRVQVSYIHQINDSTFVRDVMVNPLRLEDSGTYVCEAAVMGEFITSQAASKTAGITVNGKLLC